MYDSKDLVYVEWVKDEPFTMYYDPEAGIIIVLYQLTEHSGILTFNLLI